MERTTPPPRIRKIEFDLVVFMQMLTQGAEYRIKEGLPQGCVLLGTEMKGNVVVMRVQSVEFSQTDERDPEIDIKVDLHKPGRGWS